MGVNFSFGQQSTVADTISQIGDMLDKQAEQYRDKAQTFKALQTYADKTGIASKDKTTTMDLGSLQGLVQGAMANRQNAQQQQENLLKAAQVNHFQQQTADLADALAERKSNRTKEDAFNALAAHMATTAGGGDPTNDLPAYADRQGASAEMDPNALLSAAAQTSTLGNPNLDRLMVGLERAANARQANLERSQMNGPVTPPVTGTLPGGMNWAGFPGTKVRTMYPDQGAGYVPAIDATTGQPIAGQYTLGNKPISVPQPSGAPQQNADRELVSDMEGKITKLEDNITGWNYAAQKNTDDPKKYKAPDPEQLKYWKKRMADLEAIRSKAAGNLLGGTPAAAGSAPATARATTLPPPGAYSTPAEAKRAGKKAGDIVPMWNPATGRYQRFQLE